MVSNNFHNSYNTVKVIIMRPNNFFGGPLTKYLILVIAFCFITFYQAILTLILCARFQVFLLFVDIMILFFGIFCLIFHK